jgi:hypothetical protein
VKGREGERQGEGETERRERQRERGRERREKRASHAGLVGEREEGSTRDHDLGLTGMWEGGLHGLQRK